MPSCANEDATAVLRGRDLTNTVHVVTGGDSGLGYTTSAALAAAKATVVIASRDESKGRAAAAQLIEETGNARVSFVLIDLADFASVRRAASQVREQHGRCLLYTSPSPRDA